MDWTQSALQIKWNLKTNKMQRNMRRNRKIRSTQNSRINWLNWLFVSQRIFVSFSLFLFLSFGHNFRPVREKKGEDQKKNHSKVNFQEEICCYHEEVKDYFIWSVSTCAWLRFQCRFWSFVWCFFFVFFSSIIRFVHFLIRNRRGGKRKRKKEKNKKLRFISDLTIMNGFTSIRGHSTNWILFLMWIFRFCCPLFSCRESYHNSNRQDNKKRSFPMNKSGFSSDFFFVFVVMKAEREDKVDDDDDFKKWNEKKR